MHLFRLLILNYFVDINLFCGKKKKTKMTWFEICRVASEFVEKMDLNLLILGVQKHEDVVALLKKNICILKTFKELFFFMNCGI